MEDELAIDSPEVLDELCSALTAFSNGVNDQLPVIDRHIQQITEQLRREVERRRRNQHAAQHAVKEAEDNLRRCQTSYTIDRDGKRAPLDTRREKESLRRSQQQEMACDQALQKAIYWQSRVQQAVDQFIKQKNGLLYLTKTHTDRSIFRLKDLRHRYEAVHRSGPTIAASIAPADFDSQPATTSTFDLVDHIVYGLLGNDTYSQYNRQTDEIIITQDFQGANALLIEPFIQHERIHKKYKSADPTDEASLNKYVEEELEAYKTQYETWMHNSALYQAPSQRSLPDQMALEALRELELYIKDSWEKFCQELINKYRERMENMQRS
jgi:hypothetical protein